jgi:hypothetical protein
MLNFLCFWLHNFRECTIRRFWAFINLNLVGQCTDRGLVCQVKQRQLNWASADRE